MVTMKVARMISKTLLGMATIIGFCIFLSASIQARSCNCSNGYSDQVLWSSFILTIYIRLVELIGRRVKKFALLRTIDWW